MGVGSGEVELELTRPLPDLHAAYRYTSQIHLKLARPRLDGQCKGSSLAKLQLVAGNAAEDSRDLLEGRPALGDPNRSTFLYYPGRTFAGRVVTGAGYPGFCPTRFGLEVAGRQGDPQQVQVFRGGVGDLNRHLCHGRLLSCAFSCPLILRRSKELVVYRMNFTASRCRVSSPASSTCFSFAFNYYYGRLSKPRALSQGRLQWVYRYRCHSQDQRLGG